MALIDELHLHLKAGKGGDGVVRWLREKFKPWGGPAGGDGGNGGNVYVKAVRDTNALFQYKRVSEMKAGDGEAGKSFSKFGKKGEDLIIDLPVGTVITNKQTGRTFELLTEGEKELILQGGAGGLGNERFKSSTNRAPKESTPGKEGEEADFFIELRIIADVGLVGFPNAGKSSLLNALTRSQAKVGNYQFTTLDPNLGDLYGYIIADIPGIIEGASEGKGLGFDFLRHIQRTGMILHCVSLENEDVVKAYQTIRTELSAYDTVLAKKEEIILLTKSDLLPEAEVEKKKKLLKKFSDTVLHVSVIDEKSLKELSDFLVKRLQAKGAKSSE